MLEGLINDHASEADFRILRPVFRLHLFELGFRLWRADLSSVRGDYRPVRSDF